MANLENKFPQMQEMDNKFPQLPEMDHKFPRLPEMDNKFPQLPEMDSKFPQLPEMDSKFPQLPEMDNKFPQLPEMDNKFPQLPEMDNKFSQLAEMDNKFPQMSEMDKFPQMSEMDNKFPGMSEMDNKFPGMSEMDNKFPQMPEMDNKFPQMAEMDNKFPQMADIENKYSQMADIENKFPQVPNMENKFPPTPDLENKLIQGPEMENKIAPLPEIENKLSQQPEINLTPATVKERPDSLISYEWANILMTTYKTGVLENSYKMLVLFSIIEQSLNVGDKLLVFSQSLLTLDLIERFLADRYMPNRPGFPPNERWMKNHNYCRLDGKTHAQERERLINCFNRSSTMFLFLLSTRAGCLGINLIGANRIVVFDASWNPCHDAQAVCRIYRYGQQKPCFIYRLVTDNCLEKKVYDRQINKQGMSDRVVDELSPESNFTWKEVSTLVSEEEDDVPEQDFTPVLPKLNDHILKYLCGDLARTLSKEPFEHESLLLDRKDLKLTKQEKKLAKQSYEMEKKGGFGRYNNNYYRGGILRPPFPHGATIRGNVMYASHGMSGGTRFLPSQSTPVPMQPGQYRPPNKNNNNSTVLIRALLHQGVMVRRVTPSNDLNVSMSSGESNMVTIPAGQEVLVMRTPKGVYLRVPDGRIIAVRLPPELLSQWQAIGTTTTVGTGDPPQQRNFVRAPNAGGKGQPFGSQIVQPNLQCGGSVKVNSGKKGDDEGQPEVINLSDEDENGSKKPPNSEGGDVVTPPIVTMNNNMMKPRVYMGAPRGRPPNPPRIIRVPISSQELRKHNQTGQAPRIIIKQVPKQGGPPQTVTVMQASQAAKLNQAISITKTGMQKNEITGLSNAKIISALKKGPAGQTITIVRNPLGVASVRNQAMRPSAPQGQFLKRVMVSGPRPSNPVLLNPKAPSQSGMQIIPINKPDSGLPTASGDGKSEDGMADNQGLQHPDARSELNISRTDLDTGGFQLPRIPASVTITPVPITTHPIPPQSSVGAGTLLQQSGDGGTQQHKDLDVGSETGNPAGNGNDVFEKDMVSVNGKHFSSVASALGSMHSGAPSVQLLDHQGKDKEEHRSDSSNSTSAAQNNPVSMAGMPFGPSFSQNSVSLLKPTSVTSSEEVRGPLSSGMSSLSKDNLTTAQSTIPPATNVSSLQTTQAGSDAGAATGTQGAPAYSQNSDLLPPASPSIPPPATGSSNSSFIRMPDFSQGTGFNDSRFEVPPMSGGRPFNTSTLGNPNIPVSNSTVSSPSYQPSSRSAQPLAASSAGSVGSTFTDSVFTNRFVSSFGSDSMHSVHSEVDSAKSMMSPGSFGRQPFGDVTPSVPTSLSGQQKVTSTGTAPPTSGSTQKALPTSRNGQTSAASSSSSSNSSITTSTSATITRAPTEKNSRSSRNASKDVQRSSSSSSEKTSDTSKSVSAASSANQSSTTTVSSSATPGGFPFGASAGFSGDPLTFPSETSLRSFGDEPYRPPEPIGFPQERSFGLYEQGFYADTGYPYGMPNQYSSFQSVPPFGDQAAGTYDSPTYHHLGGPYSNQLQPLEQRSSPGFSYGYSGGTASNAHSYLPNFDMMSSPKYNENSSTPSTTGRQTFSNMQFSPRSHYLPPLSSQSSNSSAGSAGGSSQNATTPFSQSPMGYPPSPTQSLANLFSGSIP